MFYRTSVSATKFKHRSLMRPMYHLVDFVPGLHYFWRRDVVRAEKARDNVLRSFSEILKDLEADNALGQSLPKCFGSDIVRREQQGEISELDKVMLAASWIIGPQASVSAVPTLILTGLETHRHTRSPHFLCISFKSFRIDLIYKNLLIKSLIKLWDSNDFQQ